MSLSAYVCVCLKILNSLSLKYLFLEFVFHRLKSLKLNQNTHPSQKMPGKMAKRV